MTNQPSAKKQHPLIVALCVVLSVMILLGGFILLKDVVMWDVLYADNKSLPADVNAQIKSLVISAVKERCSAYSDLDPSEIYDLTEEAKEYSSGPAESRSAFCLIESGFMKKFHMIEPNTYSGIVQSFYPEEYFYLITIRIENGEARIVSWGHDI